ncbi:MAG: transporter substrate-binding domain-containing protein [Collinsella sp.]
MSKNLSQQVVLDRRGFVAATFATVAGLGLAGCSDTSAEADKGSATGSSKGSEDTEASTTLDAKAFDKLVDNGPKADDDAIAASTWATAVKDAGVFKIGGVQTSTLFSLLNEKDGQTRGFDAGIAQLLSNYILGENKVEITQVTSDTRESVLQNGQVDAVFATYTITDERKKLVSFAGPYYYTQQAILVLADNDDIKSVDDLPTRTSPSSPAPTAPPSWRSSLPRPASRSLRPTRRPARHSSRAALTPTSSTTTCSRAPWSASPVSTRSPASPSATRSPMALVCRSIPTASPSLTTSLRKSRTTAPGPSCGRSASATVRATPMFPSCPKSAPRQRAGNGRNETIRKRMMRFIAVNCFLTELSGLPYTRGPLSLSAGGPHESLRTLVALWPELYRRAASDLGHDA